MGKAFDALSVPDIGQYQKLRAIGFEVASGYTRVWTIDRILEALAVGFGILPIDESGNPDHVGYFTPDQGKADGLAFVAWADSVGMPRGVPFVGVNLDFDCPAGEMGGPILSYVNEKFNAVAFRNPMWLYGPYDCIQYAARAPWAALAGFLQAQADSWSAGRNATPSPYADIVQVGGAVVAGVPLDVSVTRTGARFWRAA